MTTSSLYRAEGLDPLVSIADDDPLLATLDEVMLGWRVVPVPGAGQGLEPAIQIERGDAGWNCSGETYNTPAFYRDPVATACSLIAALYKAHTLRGSDGLILHAAGVRVGDGLALLTGHYGAGKSVVTAACAAAGQQIFSDDIIALTPDGSTAHAPGLAIRLRLPLPENLSQSTRGFVDAHRIASSQRYAYIRPPADLLASRGEAAPVSAVVLLSRVEGAAPGLHRVGSGDALGEAIRRNFAREIPAGRILAALDGLVGRVPCLKLTYDRAEDAAALLAKGLGWAAADISGPAITRPVPTTRRRCRPISASTRISRQDGTQTRERDGQAFLTDADEHVIFNLNQTGAAVWRLLATPLDFGELLAIFVAGFPDRDPDGIASDLSLLIRDLAASGLVKMR